MKLLEEYQELIERDSVEISYFWKIIQMFFYLLCAISGYVSSILFYVIWYHIFGDICPLWAKTSVGVELEPEPDHIIHNHASEINYLKWWKYIIITDDYDHRCKMYLVTCFLSCIFGIVWITFFFMCGKGGHDTTKYESSWRIVFPATFFNIIFTLLITYETFQLKGYEAFSIDIKNHFLNISSDHEDRKNISECEIMQKYVEIQNVDKYDTCKMFSWLQIFSRIMMWSWIGGLIVLIVRVMIILDFNILNVWVYEVPEKYSLINLGNNIKDNIEGNIEKSKEKED